MEEKIFELIYNYSFNKRIADTDFIDKLIEIVVITKELESFLERVKYDNYKAIENNGTIDVAAYNVINREMKVYPLELLRYLDMYSRDSHLIFDYDEQFFYRNLLIARVLLHELEHVDQNKKYHSSMNDTEATLVRTSFHINYEFKDLYETYNKMILDGYTQEQIKEHLLEVYRKTKQYYDYNPVERMADIKAFQTLNKIFLVERGYEALKKYTLFKYYKSLTSGYILDEKLGLVSPTLIYCNGMGLESELLKLPFYDDDTMKMEDKLVGMHSVDERLLYGLPVPKKEYLKVKEIIK